MLSGDRRGDTPKTEGGGGRGIDPLCVYVTLIFFLSFFSIARAQQAPDGPGYVLTQSQREQLESLELVARACPALILPGQEVYVIRPGEKARKHRRVAELVRACDRMLERKALGDRPCVEPRDGVCTHSEGTR